MQMLWIKHNQIGFRKGFCISGHIFTLETIADSYLQGGQNPYAYFVVYRKAMTQLAKHGISTRFINSILQPQVVCKTVKTLG